MMPSGGPYDIEYGAPVAKALPGGGALLIEGPTLHWFDGQGAELAALPHGFWEADGILSAAYELEPDAISVRADGHVFIARGSDGADVVIREFVDGTLVGDVLVATPVDSPEMSGLFALGADEWLLVGDGSAYENAFLLRTDPLGNPVFEETWRLFDDEEGYYDSITFAALDEAGHLLVGTTAMTQTILDPADGTVIADLEVGDFLPDAAGSNAGPGFAILDDYAGGEFDGVVVGVDGTGQELWTVTYDRAMTSDSFFTIGARAGGGYVVGGHDGVWWENRFGSFEHQPLMISLDEAGNAEWLARLSIQGRAESVDVGTDSVFAAGRSRDGCDPEILYWAWIGRW